MVSGEGNGVLDNLIDNIGCLTARNIFICRRKLAQIDGLVLVFSCIGNHKFRTWKKEGRETIRKILLNILLSVPRNGTKLESRLALWRATTFFC
ncbi:hypothetical protein F511_15046 [Dorcoceras hygrometricum]|uniref:Uncharacterized protein n=1 Tax=Dorcoceras hygrometricum TaxID=472368 RepID=A0A2Z7BS82_9LAMI|nr:hypothetical protein F511_15046 [Dorcoceras hygrometricum]